MTVSKPQRQPGHQPLVPPCNRSRWLSSNCSKAAYERYILWYQPVWISSIALVVVTEAYEWWDPWMYLLYGVALALGPAVPALFWTLDADKSLPWSDRFAVKANLWCGIVTYIGNHVITHFFYSLMRARYTGTLAECHQLNKVPLCLYFITHAYFTGYYTAANIVLRRINIESNFNSISSDETMHAVDETTSTAPHVAFLSKAFDDAGLTYKRHTPTTPTQFSTATSDDLRCKAKAAIGTSYNIKWPRTVACVLALACFVALAETFTIAAFPYYTFENRLDEMAHQPRRRLLDVAIDACGAMMLVFMAMDGWRLVIGSLQDINNDNMPDGAGSKENVLPPYAYN